MPELFGVAGKPILHSLSPQLFNAAFKEKGINAAYTRISSDDPIETLKIVKEGGFSGINVTSPLKEKIVRLLDSVDETAKKIGAVNTILVKDKKFAGFNTDHLGVVFALKESGIKIRGKKAVVLGAGGAAKAAAFGLVSSGARVVIANRTRKKALNAARKIGCNSVKLGKASEEIKNSDILVSCIPSKNPLPGFFSLHKGLVVLDANYANESQLVLAARQKSCKVVDGKKWLAFQAAFSFRIFTGKKAPLSLMMKKAFSKNVTRPKNIALIGFMGTGKTSTGKSLAQFSSKKFFDIDEIIEKKLGKKIKFIFEEQGERFFRKAETQELKKISREKNAVVSCGGGIVLNKSNISVLKKKFETFWLFSSAKDIFARTKNDDSRPLLQSHEKEKTIKMLFDHRRGNYALASSAIISTSNKSPKKIAEEILNEIRAAR